MHYGLLALILLFSVFCTQTVNAQDHLPLKHTVKSGETINSIASRYGVPVNDLLLRNDFPEGVKLNPGQVVLLRELTAEEIAEKEASSKGARKTTNQQYEQRTVNTPEKEDRPAPSKPVERKVETSTPASTTAPAPGGSVQVGPGGVQYRVSEDGYHTVEKGQTFYRIALIYGLTVDQLRNLNNMPNMNISVGQKLRVK